jgi:hypothetical protein
LSVSFKRSFRVRVRRDALINKIPIITAWTNIISNMVNIIIRELENEKKVFSIFKKSKQVSYPSKENVVVVKSNFFKADLRGVSSIRLARIFMAKIKVEISY